MNPYELSTLKRLENQQKKRSSYKKKARKNY